MIARIFTCVLVVFGGALPVFAQSNLLTLRQDYNQVSAEVDSVVRGMERLDAKALAGPKLPEGRENRIVPRGMSLVMIFWADDEAQVWLNDYLVGETRLTPVEVTVPDLYLRGENRIRARCWDTDWVESGFLCGLYLKDGSGKLHPILASDGHWQTPHGNASEITYAHPLPNIPGAVPIWGDRIFGVVELSVTFGQKAVVGAANKAAVAPGTPTQAKRDPMDYHAFVQELSVLQARRENIKEKLAAAGAGLADVPVFNEQGRFSIGLTLGKAGPLTEDVSEPVAEQVRAWSRELPEAQQHLIYPNQRALKGEAAANLTDGGAVPTAGAVGQREDAYRPPEDRGAAQQGKGKGQRGKGANGQSNLEGEGQDGAAGGGSGGGAGRSVRLGLLFPTIILGLYVIYVITHWQTVMGREETH